MNVLIFVSTILMLLAIITYGRLETYRTNQGYELLFNHYMEESERGFINLAAKRKYDATTASKRENSVAATPRIPATPRVSIHYLVKEEDRNSHPKEAEQLTIMLRKLMINLYGDQPFYKEIEQKRPTFLSEIITLIERASANLPEKEKIKKATQLANLNLGDEELNEVFYKMLHGAPLLEIHPEEKGREKFIPTIRPQEEMGTEIEQEDDKQSQDIATIEAKDYKSPKGYYSLLDYITAYNSSKVRIYLAPREVLKVIFNDDAVVDDIIKMRQEIYRSIKNDKNLDIKVASDSFRNTFDSRRDSLFDSSVLDYSVSKTNPKKYE